MICRIRLKVLPNSKKDSIEYLNTNPVNSQPADPAPLDLKVKTTAPALEGKANKALIAFLAREWKLKKRDIRIIAGEKSRIKIIEIEAAKLPEICQQKPDKEH